jgi:hypothetical protein
MPTSPAHFRSPLVTVAAVLALAAAPAAHAQATDSASSAQAITWLNAQRAANGIPAGITDNPAWDQGCADHIKWREQNPNAPNPHIETPETPGYTEDGAFAGAHAVLGGTWSASTQYPWGAANPWETAPGHLMQLLGADLAVTGYAPGCMITWAGYQRAGTTSPRLFTYPGNGTDFISGQELAAEWPATPGSLVGIPQGTITGPYLFVLGYGTGFGALTSASLSGPTGPLAVVTTDNIVDPGYEPPGGTLIPIAPLTPGATYTASATFTPHTRDYFEENGGPSAPQAVIWSFTVALNPATLNDTFEQYSLSADSNSSAPIVVTITRLPSGTLVRTLTLTPGDAANINLPGATYRACFTQPASGPYSPAAPDCQQQSWTSQPHLTLGRARLQRRRRLLVPLRVSAALAGGHAELRLTVPLRICRTSRHRLRCKAAARVFYKRSLTLTPNQTLSLPVRAREHVTVDLPAQSRGDFLFSDASIGAELAG